MTFERVLRAAIVVGALIDGSVAILALFFQNLIEPLLGVAIKDPAITAFLGGELAVVTCLYIAIFRNLEGYRALLVIVALDQLLAALIPAVEIGRGLVPGTLQTIGPVPLSALLAVVLFLGSRRRTSIAVALVCLAMCSAQPAVAANSSSPARHLIAVMYEVSCDPVESKSAGADATGRAMALAAGDAALEKGRCSTAIADYGSYIDAQPDSVKGYWRRALAEASEALSQTNWYDGFDRVDADIAKAISIRADVAGFDVLSGYANLVQGEALFRHPGFLVERKAKRYYATGYDDCSKAIDLAPDSGEAYTMRYRIDSANKDDQKAQADLQKAGSLDRDGLAHAQNDRDGVTPQLDDQQTAKEKRALQTFFAAMTAAGF